MLALRSEMPNGAWRMKVNKWLTTTLQRTKEEAKKEGYDTGREDEAIDWHKDLSNIIADAKKEERERIFDILLGKFPDFTEEELRALITNQ